MTRRCALFGLAVLLVAWSADAHHSFAKNYAEETLITMEGTVVSFEFRNPHSWVYFMAADSAGVMRKYGAEWASPNRLSQQGMTASTIKAGDRVTISGSPSRTVTDYAVHLKSISRADDGWGWPAGRRRR